MSQTLNHTLANHFSPKVKSAIPLACLDKLGIPKDNPAWSKVAPVAELLVSLESCSPMILPDFNDEEFMNRPDEEEGAEAPTIEVTQPHRGGCPACGRSCPASGGGYPARGGS
ncbi:hypothetical protein Acr_00g0095460 [Actinidia rufa]|uniref:Uncharacterized protein n=1 Tax=Actinidia rufa TaxID=165716 RepID=A0A7J0DYH0_9ERIC|nr:hypothetical protein Acr_00g0095460 [Actinidia rufa]